MSWLVSPRRRTTSRRSSTPANRLCRWGDLGLHLRHAIRTKPCMMCGWSITFFSFHFVYHQSPLLVSRRAYRHGKSAFIVFLPAILFHLPIPNTIPCQQYPHNPFFDTSAVTFRPPLKSSPVVYAHSTIPFQCPIRRFLRLLSC